MAKSLMTDEEVELEIERLSRNEHVLLAKKEKQVRERRRQYLYNLRSFEKKGKELAAAGVTMESLCQLDVEDDDK